MTTKKEKKSTGKRAKSTPVMSYEDETPTDLMLMIDDAASTNVNVDSNERACFTLGDQQDRVLVATSDEVTITSSSDQRKTVSFSTNRWAHFLAVLTNVDDEAKELNRKSRPVAYRHHIGDGYYVSVTDGVMCVDIRRFYVPYGLTSDQIRPSKAGLALRLDEWAEFVLIIPAINETFPTLAQAKRCTDEESHLSQLGWAACTSCFPFDTRVVL